MKTITELIAEVNGLKKHAGEIENALQEIDEAQNASKILVDMGTLMKRASSSKMAGHILTEKNDPVVSEAYLTLLVSLVSVNAPTKGKNNSLEYPCRIAAALSTPPDMNILLKKSLIINETTMADYAGIITQQSLAEIFVLDGLSVIAAYDKNNTGKIDYLAELATLLGVSPKVMGELLDMFSSIMDKSFGYFRFVHTDAGHILPYIKNKCSGFIIDSPKLFFVHGDDKQSIPSDYEKIIEKIETRDNVLFYNLTFKNKKTPLIFSEISELNIIGCTFLNFNHMVFKSDGVANISIKSSVFKNCVRDESSRYRGGQSKGYVKYKEYRERNGNPILDFAGLFGGRLSALDGGVLAQMSDTQKLDMSDNNFINCYVKFDPDDEKSRFSLFEDTSDTKVVLTSCKEQNSCPICFQYG